MIENNSIIICSNSYKNQLLKSINKLINVKFMTMDKFIDSFLFSYDEKAILYLMKKYSIDYDIALEYLKNLKYIEDTHYSSAKLEFLKNIKDELDDNNLLIYDTNFKKYIENKNIIIYKHRLSKFEKYIFRNLKYNVVQKDIKNYKHVVYEFNTIEEEVEYVAREISKLINSGISIDNIKLTNISDDYISVINKIFNFYNLKIDKYTNIKLISNEISKTFYNNIDKGLNEALESINKYSNTDTYNSIIDICNKYAWCDNIDDLKTLIYHDLNTNYMKNIKYTNTIEVIDFKDYDFDDEYVFMLGFNQELIPHIVKDEDYINDSIKPSYVDGTIDINKNERINILESISSIKNLIITYKLNDSFKSYYPSNLIDELNMEVEKKEIDYKTSYSSVSDEILLTNCLDNFIKFGTKSNTLELLSSNYDIPYNTYSHKFTGIDKNKLLKYINSLKKFNLSYTMMDNYYRCSFKFYVSKILNLRSSKENFSATLGSIYHYALEKCINKNLNVKDVVYNYIKDNNLSLTRANKFFIDISIKNIEYLLKVIEKQNSYSNLNKIETEKFISIPIKDNINFIGFIDKIVYENINNFIYAAIIDYKTYVKKPSLKYLDYGIELQLPTYMYLSKYSYKNIKFAGFYLQNIIFDNKSKMDVDNSLKLIGYTNTDTNILKEFDSSYASSNVISGLKVNNDGSFSSNSLKYMLSDSQIDNIIDLTKKKIDEAVDNILNSKFDINPKYDKGNIGCDFCEYKDICFMKEYDFVKIHVGDEDE